MEELVAFFQKERLVQKEVQGWDTIVVSRRKDSSRPQIFLGPRKCIYG